MMTHRTGCDCDQCLLVQMCAANDAARQRGWEAWYRRDAATLQTFIEQRCRVLQCPEHSEDLLHDTFVTGFRNISSGRYREQGKALCAYLHGIARNLVYEVFRLQRKEKIDPAQMEAQISMQISIEDQLYLDEVRQFVAEARKGQPQLSQRVVEGLYTQGKSSDEIALELQKTAGNTRAIAHRAIHEIQQTLAQQHDVHLSSSAIRETLKLL